MPEERIVGSAMECTMAGNVLTSGIKLLQVHSCEEGWGPLHSLRPRIV